MDTFLMGDHQRASLDPIIIRHSRRALKILSTTVRCERRVQMHYCCTEVAAFASNTLQNAQKTMPDANHHQFDHRHCIGCQKDLRLLLTEKRPRYTHVPAPSLAQRRALSQQRAMLQPRVLRPGELWQAYGGGSGTVAFGSSSV